MRDRKIRVPIQHVSGSFLSTMRKELAALPPSEPDPALMLKLGRVERACLATVSIVVAVNMAGWLIPALGRIFQGGLYLMKAESALGALLSALCLRLVEPRQTRKMHGLGLVLAGLVAALGVGFLLAGRQGILLEVERLIPYESGADFAGRMSTQTACGFALLGICMIMLRAHKRYAVVVGDVLTFCLCTLVLVLVSGYIFGTLSAFGNQATIPTSPQTLFCLMLLTMVVVLRRTGNGVFSIFAGHGIGGRLARTLSPVLLALPFAREGARAHLLGNSLMPTHYATAMLASAAAVLSLGLLLILAWRINIMETKIHELTLRDELTGLNNLRGFHMLAEQALRLAQRSSLPFSVLFIDLDDLKFVNDTLGHSAGSRFLIEAAEILQATFRETDVLGRIGGDEFAVAGQFSEFAIEKASLRLEELCTEKNAEADRKFVLSLSVGHVTTRDEGRDTLDELLATADEAMYEEKRRKKMQAN